jgi:hypothetical protein
MVVEGTNDTRLAIECDGDKYHGPMHWEQDMCRQKNLERVGWQFFRCFASTFIRNKKAVVEELLLKLEELGIDPVGIDALPTSVYTESRRVKGMSPPTDISLS